MKYHRINRAEEKIIRRCFVERTAFGMGSKWTGSKKAQHAVLEDDAWYATPQLRHLKDTAMNQLGTSGTGNHFVEWGSFTLHEPMFGLQPGEYLALLSHSGSRGVGAKIADRFSKLAMEKHPDLDKAVRYLAWLSLDSEDGQEYWLSMNWLGDSLQPITTLSITASPRQWDSKKLASLRIITTSHGLRNYPMVKMSSSIGKAPRLQVQESWA